MFKKIMPVVVLVAATACFEAPSPWQLDALVDTTQDAQRPADIPTDAKKADAISDVAVPDGLGEDGKLAIDLPDVFELTDAPFGDADLSTDIPIDLIQPDLSDVSETMDGTGNDAVYDALFDAETEGDYVSGDAGEGVCTPDCEEKQCGPDGCGGICGSCGDGGECLANSQCQCFTLECLDTCCLEDEICCELDDECDQPGCCLPSCEGKLCGSDGCNGSCGSCDPGYFCGLGPDGSDCQADCNALCQDLDCGPAGAADECDCGGCDDDNACTDDTCALSGLCQYMPNFAGCNDNNPLHLERPLRFR